MGFLIGVRYLTAYSVAAKRPGGDPEWPPHPARLFMALAAAHFESPGDSSATDSARLAQTTAAEREALLWLESLHEAPSMAAPEVYLRTNVTHFVPVNDDPGGKKASPLQCVSGISRSRAGRQYPKLWLDDETAYFAWRDAVPEGHAKALSRLCGKVTRLGHSSTLVQVWLEREKEVPPPNWVPDDDAPLRQLRVVSGGLLAYLEEQYGERLRLEHRAHEQRLEELRAARKSVRGKGSREKRAAIDEQIADLEAKAPAQPREPIRPRIGLWQGYSRPPEEQDSAIPGTVWDRRLVVLKLTLARGETPSRLDLTATLLLMQKMHETMLSHGHRIYCGCERWENGSPREPRQYLECWGKLPAWLSAHKSDGSATEEPHLAYFPLGFVGSQHADGHILGVAIALPSNLGAAARREAWRVVWQVTHSDEGLKLGALGRWILSPEERERPPVALQQEQWAQSGAGSRYWATVTPIVFDRHPKSRKRDAYDAEVWEMIADGCERIGLPRPCEVIVTNVSAHLGAPASHQFPRLFRKDNSERRHAHAILIFEEPVAGPIAIGAGRYRGYGFCRPLSGWD